MVNHLNISIMKQILFTIFTFLTVTAFAQSYEDSTLTIQSTQRFAWWVTKSIQINADNRKLPDVLRNYVGSGTRPDSTFNVTLKAGLIRDGMELLLTRPLLLSYNDYRSIMMNQPSIANYTRLDQQITTKATQGDKAAIWLRDWYVERLKNFTDLYDEEKARIIRLVQ